MFFCLRHQCLKTVLRKIVPNGTIQIWLGLIPTSPMPHLWYCKKQQKRLTLRARLSYLENSDQCIKCTSCSSFYAWSWSKSGVNPFKTLPWPSSQSIEILPRKAEMSTKEWHWYLKTAGEAWFLFGLLSFSW